MAGLAPGTLKNVDAHQRKVILYLSDYAPSTKQEVMADLHMEARVAGKALGWLTCRGLAKAVGDGWSLTEDGHKAAHTIITISNMIARLGAPRSSVPIHDDSPPMEGYRKNPLTYPRREWAVQLYQGGRGRTT